MAITFFVLSQTSLAFAGVTRVPFTRTRRQPEINLALLFVVVNNSKRILICTVNDDVENLDIDEQKVRVKV